MGQMTWKLLNRRSSIKIAPEAAVLVLFHQNWGIQKTIPARPPVWRHVSLCPHCTTLLSPPPQQQARCRWTGNLPSLHGAARRWPPPPSTRLIFPKRDVPFTLPKVTSQCGACPSSCLLTNTQTHTHTLMHDLLSCAADAADRWGPFEGAFDVSYVQEQGNKM